MGRHWDHAVRHPKRPRLELVRDGQASPQAETRTRRPLDLAGLWRVFDRHLLITDRDYLAVLTGAVLAHRLAGPPVWLLIVAPSGGTKTEVLQTLYDCPGIYPLSTLTARTFASGLLPPDAKPGKDSKDKGSKQAKNNKQATKPPSLLLRLSDEILVIKDFTTILEGRREDRQIVLAQLREIHDGRFDKAFGTGVEVNWKGRLGFVAGVTQVFDRHQAAMAVCGERFLTYRPHLPPRRALARRALDGEGNEQKMRAELARAMCRFLASRDLSVVPTVDEDAKTHLVAIADLVTRARSPVPRHGRSRDLEHAPDPEAPTRFAKTLQAHAKGMALAHDSRRVTDRELAIVERVALDCLTTSPPRRARGPRRAAPQERRHARRGRRHGHDQQERHVSCAPRPDCPRRRHEDQQEGPLGAPSPLPRPPPAARRRRRRDGGPYRQGGLFGNGPSAHRRGRHSRKVRGEYTRAEGAHRHTRQTRVSLPINLPLSLSPDGGGRRRRAGLLP